MYNELDSYFPYIVFFYGTVMTIVTHIPHIKTQAQQQFNSEILQRFYAHQPLGLICLFVGGLWSLQRLFL